MHSQEKITWVFLVKKFNKKYIPSIVKDKLAMDFQELRQEQMTLSQYKIKFTSYREILESWCLKREKKQEVCKGFEIGNQE